jgi:hypothetical protein
MYVDVVMKLPPTETHTTGDATITKFLMQKLYNRRTTSKKIMGY